MMYRFLKLSPSQMIANEGITLEFYFAEQRYQLPF